MASAACDLGPYEDQPTVTGPPIQVVGSNIGPGNTYTIDQPVTLSFNRFLNPASITRQAIYLEDSSGNVLSEPIITYDPVTLTVTLSNPGGGLPWLAAGEQYQVVLNPNAQGDSGGTALGLVAIDGATLVAVQTLDFTAGAAAKNPAPSPAAVSFCTAILDGIFGNCNYAGCHTAATPAMPNTDAGQPRLGLDLSSPSGVLATAIGQVADESNTGPLATTESYGSSTPFGIDMAVITPDQPGNSWLLYKTLLEIPAGPDAGPDPSSSPISASERAILSNYILGQGMPFPMPLVAEPATSYLSETQLEQLSLWIAQGAPVPASCP